MNSAFVARTLAVLVAAAAACPANWALADYAEPLDTPATPSAMAASTQLLDIARAGNRLVAVGWRGHIIYSDDNGHSWTQASTPVDIDLTAVSFPSPEKGWAVGHGGVILNSVDGGLTWKKQMDGRSAGEMMLGYYEARVKNGDESAQKYVDDVKLNTEGGPEQPWLDVLFEDELHGYVIGTFNQLMHTSDGGKTWIPQLDLVDNPEAFHLNAISRSGGAYYIASERGTLFVKPEGSERFHAVSTGYGGSFFGILAKGNALLAFGLRGTLYSSNDRGATWSNIDSGLDTAITGGAILNNGEILAVSQGGQLLGANSNAGPFQALKVSRTAMFTGVIQAQKDQVVVIGTAGANVESVSDIR